MAKKVIETLLDDIDGSEATQTVTFGYSGKSYEIDLNDKNAEKLNKALAPFIAAGRRTGAAPSKSSSKTGRDWNIVELREWAGKKKIDVPQRGRIPQSIVDQYKAEGGK